MNRCCLSKMQKRTIALMATLRQDYNHSWPNEDEGTKRHRLEVLSQINHLACLATGEAIDDIAAIHIQPKTKWWKNMLNRLTTFQS